MMLYFGEIFNKINKYKLAETSYVDTKNIINYSQLGVPPGAL